MDSHLSMNLLKILWLHMKVVGCVLKKNYALFFVINAFWNIVAFLSLRALIICYKFWMSSKVFAHHYDVFFVTCHMILRFWVWEGFRHLVVVFFFLVFERHDFGTKLFKVRFTYQDLFQSGHWLELSVCLKFESVVYCFQFVFFWLLLVNWILV